MIYNLRDIPVDRNYGKPKRKRNWTQRVRDKTENSVSYSNSSKYNQKQCIDNNENNERKYDVQEEEF